MTKNHLEEPLFFADFQWRSTLSSAKHGIQRYMRPVHWGIADF
jgi:hypothetical protein